jgi:hypothetical protein
MLFHVYERQRAKAIYRFAAGHLSDGKSRLEIGKKDLGNP